MADVTSGYRGGPTGPVERARYSQGLTEVPYDRATQRRREVEQWLSEELRRSSGGIYTRIEAAKQAYIGSKGTLLLWSGFSQDKVMTYAYLAPPFSCIYTGEERLAFLTQPSISPNTLYPCFSPQCSSILRNLSEALGISSTVSISSLSGLLVPPYS